MQFDANGDLIGRPRWGSGPATMQITVGYGRLISGARGKYPRCDFNS